MSQDELQKEILEFEELETQATQVEHSYTADDIQVLEGLEAVRLRPGMYIGSTSARGLHGRTARKVAEGLQPVVLETSDRILELYPDLQCMAAGPQRIYPSGSRLLRPYCQQESRCCPYVSSAGY